MFRYALVRIFWVVPTIISMSLVTFIIMHLTPGSPLDPTAMGANPLSGEAQAILMAKYGLDKPLWEQYLIFVWNALHGDFGTSYANQSRAILDILRESLPVSLQIGSIALVIGIIAGLTLGSLAAMNQNGPVDYLCSILAMLAISLPSFVMAVFLIILFAFVIPVLPTGGWGADPKFWVLPVISLSLGPLAVIARYTRSSMIDVIRSDYVRTAHAKGLKNSRVVVVHVLKNALIPVLTILGPMTANIATGSFFIETIYRVPGVGRWTVISMTNRDYPFIMANVLMYGTFLAIMNVIVDLLYGVVDPRIRYGD